jgi:hypothetical protein
VNTEHEADRLQRRADAAVRVLWAGNVDASLRAICDLRSHCDFLARELTIASIAAELSPMAKAKADLSRILAAKAVAHG